jgi:DNA-binding IclR family transcriptional regulator
VTPEVLVPELQRIRADDIAYDREETIEGLCCVAAPVRSRDGAVVAAVSISAATARFERNADSYVRLIRAVAVEVSQS